jgi:hypothetical protein
VIGGQEDMIIDVAAASSGRSEIKERVATA